MNVEILDNGYTVHISPRFARVGGGPIGIGFRVTINRDNVFVGEVEVDGPAEYPSEDPRPIKPPDEEIKKAALLVAGRLAIAASELRKYGEK